MVENMYDPNQGGAWQGTEEQLRQYLQQIFGTPAPADQAAWNAYMNPTVADNKLALDTYNTRRGQMGADVFQGYDNQPMTRTQYQAQSGAPALPTFRQTGSFQPQFGQTNFQQPNFQTGLTGNMDINQLAQTIFQNRPTTPWGRY